MTWLSPSSQWRPISYYLQQGYLSNDLLNVSNEKVAKRKGESYLGGHTIIKTGRWSSFDPIQPARRKEKKAKRRGSDAEWREATRTIERALAFHGWSLSENLVFILRDRFTARSRNLPHSLAQLRKQREQLTANLAKLDAKIHKIEIEYQQLSRITPENYNTEESKTAIRSLLQSLGIEPFSRHI